MWKTWTNYSEPSIPREAPCPKPTQSGNLVALVGKADDGRVSRQPEKEHMETLLKITDDMLGYNLDGRLALVRYNKNDRGFDEYISMPFTKGVTERVTGKTLLILGSNAHHIEAMQNQFQGVIWTKDDETEVKRFGNTIRWINVGDTKNGFIGIDYNISSARTDGVAMNMNDVNFLAKVLIEFGYDENKRLYLLNPPYIRLSVDGKNMRSQGYETLKDYLERGKYIIKP
jgi:hypothetical protein